MFFFFQRVPHKSWKLSYEIHSLVDWLICWLICWDLYYLIIFGDYDKPSDWETEIPFHYEYGAYRGDAETNGNLFRSGEGSCSFQTLKGEVSDQGSLQSEK